MITLAQAGLLTIFGLWRGILSYMKMNLSSSHFIWWISLMTLSRYCCAFTVYNIRSVRLVGPLSNYWSRPSDYFVCTCHIVQQDNHQTSEIVAILSAACYWNTWRIWTLQWTSDATDLQSMPYDVLSNSDRTSYGDTWEGSELQAFLHKSQPDEGDS